MSAQNVIIKKNGAIVKIYSAEEADEVEVMWIQLWKDGPKFAEYNVGAVSETDYGGYYAWGGNKSKVDDHTGYTVRAVLKE